MRIAKTLVMCACLLCIGTVSAAENLDAYKRKFLKMVPLNVEPNVTTTFSPDILAARAENYNPVYFDRAMTIIKNLYSNEWHYFDGTAVPPAKAAEIDKKILASFPLDKAIKIDHGGKGALMIVRTAVDCPYCAKQENDLISRNGISWYVLPVSLSGENHRIAVDVYCNPNPAAAWNKVVVERKAIPSQQDCGYPEEVFSDAAFLLFKKRGAPRSVFKTGRLIPGFNLDELHKAMREAQASNAYFE